MKRKISTILLTLILCAIIISPVSAAGPIIEAGHYDIEILENGNAQVTESWSVSFDTERTYQVYFRKYQKPGSYSLANWKASIDGRPLERMPVASDSNPEYSFSIIESANEYMIEIYHKSNDVKRDFVIGYTIENAVKIYSDAADFVWDLTGSNEATTIGVLTATVTLPSGLESEESYRIWAHGPEHGTFVKDNAVQASLQVANVYTYQIVDIRVVLDPILFSGGAYIGGNKLEEILSYEKELADQANLERERQQAEYEQLAQERREWEARNPILSWLRYSRLSGVIWFLSFSFGLLMPIIIPVKAILKFEKDSKPLYIPANSPDYFRQLPDDTPPAILNHMFVNYNLPKIKSLNNQHAFSATMLDLFTEGYLEMISIGGDEIEISVNRGKTPGHDFERTLISLISSVAADKNSNAPVALKEIQSYISKHRKVVSEIRRKFEKEIAESAKESQYLEEYTRRKTGLGKMFLSIGGVGIMLGTVLGLGFAAESMEESLLFTGYLIAFVLIGIGALPILLMKEKKGFAATQLGTDRSALWMAFKKFLDDFTTFREKQFPEFRLWEKYLVYATALGASKKLIQELALQYPASSLSDESDYLRHRMFSETVSSGVLLDAVDTIQNIAYPSSDSSGSGDGGGFSSSDSGSGSGSSGSGFR
ncbi:MAG: DUF2207 domain-containing protein [Eubacteriaceae bacterium]|nr:DUF2207 domain-containing protein [Eubacteriaceae bacterium]